ncbi:lipid-A-disaccharide synthase lpxB [Candidatus Kinetoplastibacterium blastocrithidii TCC012E]|uniref:Lipid-A-disaccharide synthase n=1 Tax=Candidatus Kinetoplastidibacterium blastocrithidiae TCC012E TaxID=1208922 RepID=M1LW57_9PROT|nr:lipid-A-disaccharide synthase [Candidatus Kinetoplastibacterium blastocrithidii]AFZ83641.1 lipid-A-disaccharide synthase [Candidatus Kinetoplastibacterium blastocrithidii (ex Strigomonas culicis)]AGF49762.1 lipid-A-disaccharide synthase lpxB [Candidatus Kinetoplastibacterium blastocrithidii TCC012E]
MVLRIGLVAGEPSGDLLASYMVRDINKYINNISYDGIGGKNLIDLGFSSLFEMENLSVFGYVDAFLRLPKIYYIYKSLINRWINKNPISIFIGVDLPDFNLRIENILKRSGIPTVHFVSPSIWAWRYNRINQIREAVSHMLVVFPFEKSIYKKEGIPVTYVGHPLASKIPLNPDRDKARNILNINANKNVLAILPGSRISEIKNLAPRFLETAKLLYKKDSRLEFLVPMANETMRFEFEKILHKFPVPNIRCMSDRDYINSKDIIKKPISWYAIEASDAVLLSSGTATLESALFKKPMVISYVLSSFARKVMSWKSGQSHSYTPWIGLPNILARDFLVPEFLQEEASPENLCNATWKALTDENYRNKVINNFINIHNDLRRDTPKLISETILKILKK